jgi:hypothetical protein
MLLASGRVHQRFGTAAMASEARHMHLTVAEFGIDVRSHFDHHAGNLLLVFVIAGEIATYMAEIALDAQRRAELAHDGEDFRAGDLQHLEVLRFGHLTAGWRRPTFGLLRAKRKGECEKK